MTSPDPSGTIPPEPLDCDAAESPDRDGYPAGAAWRCEGYWVAPAGDYGILGHRDLKVTAVLDARLLREWATVLEEIAGSSEEETRGA